MSDNEPPSPDAPHDPHLPPPLPTHVTAPTPWKKIIWIVGLSLLGAIAFVVLAGALIFGGCMYFVNKLGH